METAIKAARKWGYKVKGFRRTKPRSSSSPTTSHGRTTTIVGFSTEEQYKDGFGPFTPGFRVIPYGDLAAAKEAMNENVAGILVEPIQGESGIIVPEEGFLKGLRDVTNEHKSLLMVDEIQSGLGRTGKLFAYEHEDIRPDIVIIGKALSGGLYPVSAILADDEVMSVFKPGDHGSTFGGNPLGAAVATAALSVIEDENLIQRSHELGEYFMERLRGVESTHIKEVRGKGLWIGVELHAASGGARSFCEQLQALECSAKRLRSTRSVSPRLSSSRVKRSIGPKRRSRAYSPLPRLPRQALDHSRSSLVRQSTRFSKFQRGDASRWT